uniref:Uncharacterized protein n=1 Tax=Salix viminalis TaxID=40686 RepID=A0A6N2KTX2_SALVM
MLLLVISSSSSICLRFRIMWLQNCGYCACHRMDQVKQGCSCDKKQNKTNNVRGASVVYFEYVVYSVFWWPGTENGGPRWGEAIEDPS